jgi:2,3-bisphosphoglycerate-dependent phosphoglycerate mutase
LAANSPHAFEKDRRYAGIDLPNTESLKTTLERVLPYWTHAIAVDLNAGRNVIVAAHGNSLRAIVKHLFGLSDEAIIAVEIPTGNPLLITLDGDLKPTVARYLNAARAAVLPALP